MLKRSKRIHGPHAVETIVKEGQRIPSRLFVKIALQNTVGNNRYAVVVGKKIEKSSAKRNRKRRQFFEIIRLAEQAKKMPSLPSSDIVLLVRAPALTTSFEELKAALTSLL